MAHRAALLLLLLVLALQNIHLSSCQSMKGFVSCLDCSPQHDLSGTMMAIKCKNERRLAYASTDSKGYFQAKIPTNSTSNSPWRDCFVMLLGGPKQLWAFKKSMVSRIIRAKGMENFYYLSPPLKFYTSLPQESDQRDRTHKNIPALDVSAVPASFPPTGSPPSDTWNNTLPLIFFFPFIPIIGIP